MFERINHHSHYKSSNTGTILLTKDEVPILENKNETLMISCERCSTWFDSAEIKTDKKSTLEHILYNKNSKWICHLCCRGNQIDKMVVDLDEALRRKMLVRTRDDERIEDVVRRLKLDITCERVLELNMERYRGLSLKSRTQEGTLLLTKAEIPMRLFTKRVTHSKCIHCNGWEEISSGEARTRSGVTFICSSCCVNI